MDVLLSVKPEFVERIFSGTKKYEYRKNSFRRTDVGKVIVYASSPISMIVGEFEIGNVLVGTPESIWSRTSYFSGTTREFFFNYFTENESACAIEIKDAKRYQSPINPRDVTLNFVAPQSFMYIPKTSPLSSFHGMQVKRKVAPARFFLSRSTQSLRYTAV